MNDSKTKKQSEKSPIVWLTVFEAAVRQGNIELSNRARQELKKSGIVVQPRKGEARR